MDEISGKLYLFKKSGKLYLFNFLACVHWIPAHFTLRGLKIIFHKNGRNFWKTISFQKIWKTISFQFSGVRSLDTSTFYSERLKNHFP